MAATAAVFAALSALPIFDGLDGLGIDLLLAMRDRAGIVSSTTTADPPIAIVALDEETYRRPPFADIPRALWTPQLAQILDKVLDSEPKAIGIDVIFPTTLESVIPRFDRPFMLSLRRGAETNKIVLGKAQNSDRPIVPYPAYVFAAGGPANIRSVNSVTDRDGVVRRALLALGDEPSFDLEVAARATGTPIDFRADGIYLGGRRVQARDAASPLIDFRNAPIEIYSFADLYACAEAGHADFFRTRFKDRIVLIGAVLDIEDRLLTSRRFFPPPDLSSNDRCVLQPDSVADTPRRSFIPGVYVHALAISDLAGGHRLRELTRAERAGIAALLAAVFGALTLIAGPLTLGCALAGLLLAWPLAALGAVGADIVLPLIDPVVAAVLATGAMFAYRFALTDRDKRRIRRAFGFYLPRHVVDGIARSGEMPKLGGEVREITVWFSDIQGFTEVSERMTPEELVARLNTYFAMINEIIEAHGGYIDKYLGDAVVAIFGAPITVPGHARGAVRAALACQAQLTANEENGFATRIGLNTGPALLGNIGSGQRLNYTAIGDTVNLAARLEGANKAFGTRVLVSAASAEACGAEERLREVGRIRVVGRREPVTVLEARPADCDTSSNGKFADALASFYAGHFSEAAAGFAELAAGDQVAARLRDRALAHVLNRPPDWDGVDELKQK